MNDVPNTYSLTCEEDHPETPDTKSFVLEEVHGKKINYTAGQFLTFLFIKRMVKKKEEIIPYPPYHQTMIR
jgi:ferredoxin-NADP reductase